MKVTISKCSDEVSQLLRMILNDHFETSIIENLKNVDETLDFLEPQILILGHTTGSYVERTLERNTEHNFELGDSIEDLRRMRQKSELNNLAIIILAVAPKSPRARLDRTDDFMANERILALEAGADDYLMLPFLPRELIARIKSVHRRSQNHQRFAYQGLEIDVSSHRVLLAGAEVILTLTEFNILRELVMRSGQVLSRECLRETALNNLNVTDRTIDVHMASLRKKLPAFSDCIETIRGVGYRLGLKLT